MTSISQNGGTIYIQESGADIQYSNDNTSWMTISSWPVTITNSNPASNNFLKVFFTGSVTFSDPSYYFDCGSEYIQFGSDSEQQYIIVTSSVYDGLIKNGAGGASGNNNIRVYNINIDGTSGTLNTDGGWLGKKYFGADAIDNYIIRCSSQGNISTGSGGLLGEYAANGGTLTLLGCSSSGAIGDQGGGIVGRDSGGASGNITITQCYTTGAISGEGSGGMIGANTINATIEKCYSQGVISGNNSGGIVGANPGQGGGVTITKSYSRGNITGAQAGGICGSPSPSADIASVTITNCYSTGDLDNTGGNLNGAICGFLQPAGGTIILTISNCYTTGTVVLAKGYIIANETVITGSLSGPSITCSLSSNYSEAGSAGGSAGSWSKNHANTVLQGFPTSEPGVGSTWASTGMGQAYELSNFGTTPYQEQTIDGTSLVQSYSQSVVKGDSTITALNSDASGNAFAILEIDNGDSLSYTTITISQQTGRISTTSATVAGTYTVYVRSVGSYNITTFLLTVTEASSDSGCCNLSLELKGIDYTTRAEVLSGNIIKSILSGRREAISYTDMLRIKQALAHKK